jgi:hypothetical protein
LLLLREYVLIMDFGYAGLISCGLIWLISLLRAMFSWVWFLIIISVVRDYVLLLYSILINNFIIFDVWIYDFIAKLYNHIVNVVCYFNEVYYLNNNFGTTLEVTYWSLASVQSVGHMAYSILSYFSKNRRQKRSILVLIILFIIMFLLVLNII